MRTWSEDYLMSSTLKNKMDEAFPDKEVE